MTRAAAILISITVAAAGLIVGWACREVANQPPESVDGDDL